MHISIYQEVQYVQMKSTFQRLGMKNFYNRFLLLLN
jgi:hypothetical protein